MHSASRVRVILNWLISLDPGALHVIGNSYNMATRAISNSYNMATRAINRSSARGAML